MKFFRIFNHIKCKVNLKLSRQLYHAFIYSRVWYCKEVYGCCSSTNIEKNQTMQNKLMKLLLRLRRMAPTNELHMHLNILKVSVLSFVNEILSGRSPDISKNYFIMKYYHYDMRRKGQLNVPSCLIQMNVEFLFEISKALVIFYWINFRYSATRIYSRVRPECCV